MAQKTVKVILNQTRNVYDRGRFLAGDGITEYEVTEETAKTIYEQGWGLPGGTETEHTKSAKAGKSPLTTIGMARSYRKVDEAEPINVAEPLDYSKVPVTPATATVVVRNERSRTAESAEIVPSDVGEKAVGTKSTDRKGGDASPGTAAKKGRHAEVDASGNVKVVGDEKAKSKSKDKAKTPSSTK